VQMESAVQQNEALVEAAPAASQTVNSHASKLVEKMAFVHLKKAPTTAQIEESQQPVTETIKTATSVTLEPVNA